MVQYIKDRWNVKLVLLLFVLAIIATVILTSSTTGFVDTTCTTYPTTEPSQYSLVCAKY